MSKLSRKSFLGTVAAATAASSLPAGAQTATPTFQRLSRALLLSGGGARGAYEAGIIAAVVAQNRVSDGQPLSPYGFVCGASIGALNGYMVATGQYSRLQSLWQNIAGERIIHLKPEYAAIANPTSGVGTRLQQGISLMAGLTTNVRGVIERKPVLDMIRSVADPKLPVLIPFVWTATNITMQRTEYFYLVPREIPEERKALLLQIFKRTIGPAAILREAPQGFLAETLLASASIPIAFDPMALPALEGTGVHEYVDGGVAANTPVALSRTVAQNVDIVLLDPVFAPEPYTNAVEIGFAVFGTMQRRILEGEIRGAFFESVQKKQAATIRTGSGAPLRPADLTALNEYFAEAQNTNLAYIRPKKVLPVKVGAFDDEAGIRQTVALGQQDAANGFKAFTLNDFLST